MGSEQPRSESIFGILADLGEAPSAEEIDEVQREMWAFLDDDLRWPAEDLNAVSACFNGPILQVRLTGGRTVNLNIDDLPWLAWLAKATPAQRQNWHLEPDGSAIYWDELDDGIEIRHLLALQPLG